MNTKALFAAVGAMALFSVAGCSERTEEAAETTAQSAARDTQRNVEQTGQAAERTAERTGAAAERTGENVGDAAERTAENAGQAVGDAARSASDATQDAAKTLWTAKVKNALIADKQIGAASLNVETDTQQNTVTIVGTVPTQAQKTRATEIARKALAEMKAPAKVVNNVTVGGAGGAGASGGGGTR